MDEVAQLARQLLDSGVTRLSEREQRVILHIAKRSHIARNVNSVLEEQQTLGERLADRVAQFWRVLDLHHDLHGDGHRLDCPEQRCLGPPRRGL